MIATSRRPVDGVLLLDKPAGLSSNGALMRVKRLYAAEKAGHTGTLDPLASGLLPICLGVATRFAQFLLDAPKRYLATVRFGITTTTQDTEGEIVHSQPVMLDREGLAAVLPKFVGTRLQTPPAHAALKFAGRPYYEYARKGIEIPRAPREIAVHSLQIVAWDAPDATLDIACSKGTYVRALAADLGEALGCGAHLAALRRTASGGFDVANAVTLAVLEATSEHERERCLLPASSLVAHLPSVHLDRLSATGFLQGRSVPVAENPTGARATTALPPGATSAQGPSVQAVYGPDGLLGVADVLDGVAKPRRVMPAGFRSTPRSAAAA